MNYQQTLDYLYKKLPMYQKIGKEAYKPGLERIQEFSNVLGNPQTAFKSIHIAGTNGKGSVSHMMASILQESNIKVGLYTSPHLIDFRERIKVNGTMIDEESVVSFVEKNKELVERLYPSFFEVTVAMAFDYFREQKVDIAIIEVGLGGRLDSTNIINPILSIITNISFDHMDLLGDTLPKIAFEKAGIIKEGVPVVIGERNTETDRVFIEKCAQENTSIIFAEDSPSVFYECGLKGIYQPKNISTVLQGIHVLKQFGYAISENALVQGLKNVVPNTGLYGRWQVIQHNPTVICDTGHNEAGISQVLNGINTLSFKKLHFVFGMVNDKDSGKILKKLPKNATYYFCKPSVIRGKDADLLKEESAQYVLVGDTYTSVEMAYQDAFRNATKEDLIFIGGSTFVVADFLKII